MGNTDKSHGQGQGQGQGQGHVQGEGDYEAARRYRKDVKDFVDKADIDEAAHAAAPKSSDERREMEQAERTGRSHSKAGKERDMNLQPEPKTTKQ
jgi:hypothetical protein